MSKCYLCETFHGGITEPRFRGDVGRDKPGEREVHIYMAIVAPDVGPVRICPSCLAHHLLRCSKAVKDQEDVISTGEYEHISY